MRFVMLYLSGEYSIACCGDESQFLLETEKLEIVSFRFMWYDPVFDSYITQQ